MRKVYYIYNPKTRTYDRIYPTVRQRALSILRRLFVGMGLGAGSFIILLLIFGSPSEKELRIENARLLAQYNVLSHRLDEAMGVMQDIQQRDDNLYRVVLQADPVSDAVRKAGYGGQTAMNSYGIWRMRSGYQYHSETGYVEPAALYPVQVF